jgi:hypothetical protein
MVCIEGVLTDGIEKSNPEKKVAEKKKKGLADHACI